MNSRQRLALCLAVGALTVGGVANAGTSTGNIAVSASVQANCSVTNVQPLSFGNYDPVGANASAALNQQTTFDLTCTAGFSPVVTLSLGDNEVGTQRKALRSGGTEVLDYDLYSDNSGTVWNMTTTPTITGTGVADPITIYASVPGGQTDAIAGSYTDTVVITATF